VKTRPSLRERGSALLIVFVFAAIVAISLYMEMPVAAFEAQRQKEQLLMSRGKEYAHAVKLFVRKTGHYPASLKELEDTNRMRFLRHQFKDPFTGKNDWRLLHAGPNGAIIDSKVKGGTLLPGMSPGQVNQNSPTPTSTTSFGGNSSFGSNSNGAFGNDSFAKPPQPAGTDASADSLPPDVVVQQPRSRAPAVASNGPTGTGTPADAAADAALALPPPPSGSTPQPSISGAVAPVPGSGQPDASTTTPGGTQPTAAAINGPSDLKSRMLNAQGGGTGLGGRSSSFGSSQMGTVQSGGVAGVASKAGGKSIKRVNDQDDYAKWEFFYDPTKDTVPGGTAMGAYNQQQNAQQQNGNGFGSQNGSSFGSQSGSSFGSQNNASAPNGGQPQSGFGSQNTNSSQSSFGQGGGFGAGSFGSQNSGTQPNSGSQPAQSTPTPNSGTNATPPNSNPQ
jgi:hypothetical protein